MKLHNGLTDAMSDVDYDPFAKGSLAMVASTTEAQREIWIAAQLSREASLAYNESTSLHIRGALDLALLQRALQVLPVRHEMLRATLSSDGTNLMIATQAELLAQVVDLSGCSENERDTTIAWLRAEAVETPFDLVYGPLFRATVVLLGSERAELILTGHHIAYDGWSCGLLMSELMRLYANFVTGGEGADSLPPAESFCAYSMAELDIKHVKAAEADRRYWISLYDASVPVLNLPTDRARPARRTFPSRREDMPLDATFVSAIRRFGAGHGCSLFVTMFALFGGLMARLSGSDEVVIGVPAAGQSASGKTQLVGHCINLLPIRVAADPEAPVGDLLTGTRRRILDAYEHQSCTFGGILKHLQVSRDPSRLPLVQVLFNVDAPIRSEDLSLAGLIVDLSSNPRHFENFELFLNASEVNGEILLELQYNTDLFDRTTVLRWLALYRLALERAINQPLQPLAAAFAPSADDLALLARFNDTAIDFPRTARIETLIVRQAASTPNEIAVVAGKVRLSYRELERRSNGLAALLRGYGVTAGTLVGICCGRNEHMLVGLLGILKSGAGYVPLDPSFPADRLKFMACDAGLRFVVSERSITDPWKFDAARRIDMDDVVASDAAPVFAGGAEDVAYVIFTSGSTGRPKGVKVPHGAVVNFLASMRRTPGIGAGDRLVAVTTLSFDIAVLELLLPLTMGAKVVLADRDQVRDPVALAELLARSKATMMQATPSTWRMLLDAGWHGAPGFKALIGGEALSPDLATRLLAVTTELWNMYGPTETTVWSSCWRVEAVAGAIPVGHPIANTRIHVLDSGLRPVPVGVVGELFIGGEGVTLGYLNRPELSAERFLPDPHQPGAAWYRTGDLGRWTADGVIECLGRSDNQVKVRGYRIELGEIEANLTAQRSVSAAVVITREDQPGDVRLVAYVVPHAGELDGGALRDSLRQSLPDYMIPSHIVELAILPLLPNGKVNRAALPRPEVESGPVRGEHLAARTPLESQLLAIMKQVLNLPGIGIEEDFFALGGHSMLAMRLAAQINHEFKLRLPLSTVFQAPTAARLAQAVALAKASHVPRRAPLVPSLQQGPAPATVMQERVRFVEDILPDTVAYIVPSAHRLRGPFDVQKFSDALRAMVQRQPSLRTTIVQDSSVPGARYIQLVQDSVQVDLPLIDLKEINPAQREVELMRLMQLAIDTPIPLGHAPLLRTQLYRLADNEHVFLFMTHHLVWDGWSFDLLYDEMAELYGALVEGRQHRLPPLEVSYADFARWHAEWMKGEEFGQQLAFWKARYAKLPLGVLPRSDRPRNGQMSGIGATLWIHVSKEHTDQLHEVARSCDASLSMLCMSVFALILSTSLGHPQVALGVPVRGRVENVLEPVMGFFTNLLPVHVDIDPAATVAGSIGTFKTLLAELFSNADVPFERLVQEPEVAAHIQKTGLYQALFSFQDARERRRNWGPLQHENILVKQHAATQDIGLWLMEGPAGMDGGLMYNADLYDESTAVLLHQAFEIALGQIEQDPHRSVSELLATADRRLAGCLSPMPATTTAPFSATATEPLTTASATERALAEVWARLLGIDAADQINSNDNFFDLGGSSLLAMRAVVDAEKKLGLKVDPRRFVFETLRQVARAYDEAAVQAPKKGMWNTLFGGLLSNPK
jgi:amino acid adenylation domain-containing protein